MAAEDRGQSAPAYTSEAHSNFGADLPPRTLHNTATQHKRIKNERPGIREFAMSTGYYVRSFDMKRKRMLEAAVIVACAVLVSTLSAQDDEPSYSLEGAWLGWATIEGLPQPFPFMDLYSSDSNNPGRSGTVLCTLVTGAIPGPAGGLVSGTPSSHGNWVRVGKNKFAFTAWKLLLNEVGQPVGTARFWGNVTAKASDRLAGTVNAAFYYGASGTPFVTFKGTIASQRIAVELSAQ